VVCDFDFVWPPPQPEALAKVYSSAQRMADERTSSTSVTLLRLRTFARMLDVAAERFGSPGSLLDIGSSTGELLGLAKRRGWKATGIEIDPIIARDSAERLDVEVLVGDAVEKLSSLCSFDVIVMSHWLEHVPAPRYALSRAARLLSAAGVIFVRVPNARSRREFGSLSSAFDARKLAPLR
jgi:SAM-dependent methyltransferase